MTQFLRFGMPVMILRGKYWLLFRIKVIFCDNLITPSIRPEFKKYDVKFKIEYLINGTLKVL